MKEDQSAPQKVTEQVTKLDLASVHDTDSRPARKACKQVTPWDHATQNEENERLLMTMKLAQMDRDNNP